MQKTRNNNDKAYLNNKPIFNINELADYTGISKSTLYKYTAQKMIPHFHRGKFLFFQKKQILIWLQEFPVLMIKTGVENSSNEGGFVVVDEK